MVLLALIASSIRNGEDGTLITAKTNENILGRSGFLWRRPHPRHYQQQSQAALLFILSINIACRHQHRGSDGNQPQTTNNKENTNEGKEG